LLLVLKLVLVPALVVSATMAARRWGPRVGGLLASFPIVAGPALLFFAIEQGDAFTAEAARGTLVALVAVAGSGLVYAWVSRAAPWWASLPLSWASFVLITLALRRPGLGALGALAVALASVAAARALLPVSSGAPVRARRSPWDLPLRTLSSMVVVLSVTSFAAHLGPTLSGAFTPFPVALGVLLAFTHAEQGSASAIQFMRGFLPGMWGFAVFCFVAAIAIVPLGGWQGLLLALASIMPIQLAVLWWMERAGDALRRSATAPIRGTRDS